MSHRVQYVVFPKDGNKNALLAEIAEEVEHEDWREGGHYDPSQLKWHSEKVYACREDAEDAIESLDNGWYDDHAVLFRDLDAVEFEPDSEQKRIEALIEKREEQLKELIEDASPENRSARLIGCKECGSSFNREKYAERYLRGYRGADDAKCPICGADLRSKTSLERIKAKREAIAESRERLEKHIRSRKQAKAAKAPVMWLVKYEYHV